MLSTKNKLQYFLAATLMIAVALVHAVPALAAGIIVDQSVSGPSTSLIISTSQPNELILIAANGWPATESAPTVTVDGLAAGLITFAADSSFNSGGASVFKFIAPSAGTHMIEVGEGGFSDPYFLNFAVSLLGATDAGLTFTSATFPNVTTMTASIATSTSDQYVFATSTHNTGIDSPGNPTWTGSPVTPTLLETLHVGNGIDSTIAGFNAATPGIYSATVSDSLGGEAGGVIILVTVMGTNRIDVDIDIKPGNKHNRIMIGSRGNASVQVAILSTSDFNAPQQVDKNSLTFGATGDENSLRLRFLIGTPDCRARDVNHDRIKDLVCSFLIGKTGFKLGDTVGILKGQTVDGTLLEGRDSVVITAPSYPSYPSYP